MEDIFKYLGEAVVLATAIHGGLLAFSKWFEVDFAPQSDLLTDSQEKAVVRTTKRAVVLLGNLLRGLSLFNRK